MIAQALPGVHGGTLRTERLGACSPSRDRARPARARPTYLTALTDALVDDEVAHAAIDTDEVAWAYPFPDLEQRAELLRQRVGGVPRTAAMTLLLLGEVVESTEHLAQLLDAVGADDHLLVRLDARRTCCSASASSRASLPEWSGLGAPARGDGALGAARSSELEGVHLTLDTDRIGPPEAAARIRAERPGQARRIGSRAVGLAMPVVWSDRHRLHDPGGEVWVGVRIARHRAARARRADPRRRSTDARRARSSRPSRSRTTPSPSVHDPELLELPRGRLGRLGGGRPARRSRAGPRGAVPVPAPGAVLRPRRRARPPPSRARAGQFAYDTMTLIGPGTWEAARAALDAAVTAADLVLDGAPAAYACTPPARPPRHAHRASAAPAT